MNISNHYLAAHHSDRPKLLQMLGVLFLMLLLCIPRYGAFESGVVAGIGFLFLSLILCPATIRVPRVVAFLTVPFAFVIFISLLNILTYSDIFGLLRVLRVVIVFCLIVYFARFISSQSYFAIMLFVIFWHLVFLYTEYMNIGGLREEIININKIFYESRDVVYRAKGLIAGYSAAGVYCGLSVIFTFYLFITKNALTRFAIPLFIASLFAILFTGRVGIVVALVGIAVLLLTKRRSFREHSRLLFFLFAVSIIIYSLFNVFDDAFGEYFGITLTRAFEAFRNYEAGDGLTTSSTSAIFDTYSLPSDLRVVLIGNGMQPWGSLDSTFSSDSGYFQSIYMFGLFGTLMYYFPILYIFGRSFVGALRKENGVMTLIFAITSALLVAELKGHYIYANFMLALYLPLFLNNYNTSRS